MNCILSANIIARRPCHHKYINLSPEVKEDETTTFIPSPRHERQVLLMTSSTLSTDHSPSNCCMSIRLLKKSNTYQTLVAYNVMRIWKIELCTSERSREIIGNTYCVYVLKQFTETWMVFKWLKHLLSMQYSIHNL